MFVICLKGRALDSHEERMVVRAAKSIKARNLVNDLEEDIELKPCEFEILVGSENVKVLPIKKVINYDKANKQTNHVNKNVGESAIEEHAVVAANDMKVDEKGFEKANKETSKEDIYLKLPQECDLIRKEASTEMVIDN